MSHHTQLTVSLVDSKGYKCVRLCMDHLIAGVQMAACSLAGGQRTESHFNKGVGQGQSPPGLSWVFGDEQEVVGREVRQANCKQGQA
jgi:hypothetical protein